MRSAFIISASTMKQFISLAKYGLLLLPALCCLLAADHFLAEMIRSFSLQIGLIYVGYGLIRFAKSRIRSIISLISGCAILFSLIPWIFPEAHLNKQKADFSVAHFNVLKQNEDYAELITAVRDSQADFISFQEVDEKWADELACELSDAYPWQLTVPKQKFGIAIYSKFPLGDAKIHDQSGNPWITGKICHPDSEIAFVAAHAQPPVSAAGYAARNARMNEMAAWIQAADGPALAAGDFNAVTWSPGMENFRAGAGLRDSRDSLAPTWPSWFFPLRIPIDHLLHNHQLVCHDFSVIEITGSDHYGIQASYSFRNNQLKHEYTSN